jgi:hypothetical protein
MKMKINHHVPAVELVMPAPAEFRTSSIIGHPAD